MNDKNRENLMRKIQMYGFAAHECTLYLDCHPDNKKALAKHTEMVKKYNDAMAEYQEMYGPLTANASDNKAGWAWITGKWPWQGTDMPD